MRWGLGRRSWRTLGLALAVTVTASVVPATASAAVGELDSTFGTGGVVLSLYAPGSFPETGGQGVAVAPNGDIYQTGLATDSSLNQELFLSRFLPNGMPDTSFGVGGVVLKQLDPAGGSIGEQIALLPSGNVVVAATRETTGGPSTAAIAEFTPAGALDTSFAPSSPMPGVLYVDPGIATEQDVRIAGLALQSDGKLVATIQVGLGTKDTTTGTDCFVERFNADGSVDTSFASGGTYTVPLPAGTDTTNYALSILGPIVDSAGNIVFPENLESITDSPPPIASAMQLDSLNSAGVRRPGFPASIQTSSGVTPPESGALGVIQARNGDYVAAGVASNAVGGEFAAAAFTPSGAPDTAFGGNGTGGVTVGPAGLSLPSAVVQTPDGGFALIGVGGSFFSALTGQTSPAVARLLPNGTPDPAFGQGGYVAPYLPYGTLITNAALSADGQLIGSGQEIPSAAGATPDNDALLVKVTLDEPPSLVFTSAPSAPVAGQPVTFAAATLDTESTPTVKWDLGSGSFTDATGLTATKTFASAGTYTVRAQSTDAAGESTVVTQTVTVGPGPAPTGTVTVPAPLPASECTSSPKPTTTVKSKLLLPTGLLLAGTSAAHCPSTIASVGVAIARSKHHKCSFLSAGHRWGKYGSCTPSSYVPASGTYSWAFALKQKFAAGTYWVWEHAVDNAGVATANTAGKHIALKSKGRS